MAIAIRLFSCSQSLAGLNGLKDFVMFFANRIENLQMQSILRLPTRTRREPKKVGGRRKPTPPAVIDTAEYATVGRRTRKERAAEMAMVGLIVDFLVAISL